ncbi:MAG: hypothetical protein H6551_06510 [Chitinophagales bacterium]|nr:hypothetical protein [Chitinophagales bacterium]
MLKGEASTTNIVRGTKNQTHHNNTPGLRFNSLTWYLDGKLYLYGGRTYPNHQVRATDDLWVYDTVSNNWTWISGTQVANQSPIYGTKGIGSINNSPGCREGSSTWVHNGKLYLYGGEYSNGTSSAYHNDIWMFDPVSKLWTWINGSLTNTKARYGIQGIPDTLNSPGSLINTVAWKHNNRLYVYGGQGYDTSTYGNLNDIWEYNLANNCWTWIKGSGEVGANGIWGTKNTPNNSNIPRCVPDNIGWYLNGKVYI